MIPLRKFGINDDRLGYCIAVRELKRIFIDLPLSEKKVVKDITSDYCNYSVNRLDFCDKRFNYVLVKGYFTKSNHSIANILTDMIRDPNTFLYRVIFNLLNYFNYEAKVIFLEDKWNSICEIRNKFLINYKDDCPICLNTLTD